MGDLNGLTRKLDYISSLGVNTIWLLPFYPSLRRDDGYDISDYRAVSAEYGSIEDFQAFIDEAHVRQIRVIVEHYVTRPDLKEFVAGCVSAWNIGSDAISMNSRVL
ncbi:glycosidase [Rhizobium metallidurans]|uniref:Glycosidase n=1 Tax=Rhizobium metallidurans TaxID=1265931 RepID=A0A7W6CQ24_9HYPH|nr:glycosidase [Rhizobium metallidurans]